MNGAPTRRHPPASERQRVRTPLSLFVVVVLGGISVLLALISGYQWYLEEFPTPDAPGRLP